MAKSLRTAITVDNTIEDKLNKTLKIAANTIDNIKWIEKLDFTIPSDIIKGKYKYNSKSYISSTYDYNKDNNKNSIEMVLYRFGFNFRDIEEYIFLYPDLEDEENEEKIKCFILINKYKKCIEITFYSISKSIDINQCYLFDETNKNYKNKLIYNIKKNTHPFLSIIP